jgi:D-alanyl-D-alanine carboxypeptidase/D-alanyl-D-alanine-endopeptidase (penicillin-binding protein 4)
VINGARQIRRRTGLLAAGAGAAVLWAAPGAAAANPDRAFKGPVAKGSAAARTAVSGARLASGLRRHLRRAGGRSGAFVMDAEDGRLLFANGAGRRLQLASNTKLFTTATALGRFGPNERLETSVWAADAYDTDGTVSKGLFLRGEGDPTLSTKDLRSLARKVASAGVKRVKGPVRYDDSFLDRRDGIRQRGINPDPLGTLSALTLDRGSGRAPERTAARRLGDALRRAGVKVGRKTARRTVPPASSGAREVAAVSSPPISDLARLTNVPSNNFLAEMLLKDVAGEFGRAGSTAEGIRLVKRFASERGASFRGQNGSGLSRADRASPRSVGMLLESMLSDEDAEQKELREAFIQSLAVAGRSGTLAGRMRRSAAAGRCAAKTGTISGVSALSGYCFRGDGEATVFSILNNRVDTNRARAAQDRMVALIARYTP